MQRIPKLPTFILLVLIIVIGSVFFLYPKTHTVPPVVETPTDSIISPYMNVSPISSSSSNIVKRLSNVFPGIGSSLIYSINGLWNADGTRYAHNIDSHGTVNIIDTETGRIVRAAVSFSPNGDSEFDPLNPDIFYFWNGPTIFEYSLVTGLPTPIKTFNGNLGSLGGSVDFIDRTGQYFLLNIGGQVSVWDKKADILYNGTIPTSLIIDSGGWAGISPDGQYVIISDGINHISYKINNALHTLDTLGTIFWTLCGDHGDIVSTSEGRTYEIVANCYDASEVWRVDVSAAKFPYGALFSNDHIFSPTEIAREKLGNVKLFDLTWKDSAHFSCARKADYCFISVESEDDTFQNAGENRKYKSQILRALMIPPYTVSIIVPHKSKGKTYQAQPRVDSFWDGTKAMYASDSGFTGGESGYSDIYSVLVGK